MSVSLAIQPIGLSSLAGISSLALQRSMTAMSTLVSTAVDSGSSIVALSGSGQLLSAVSSFENKLEVLQASTANPSPTDVIATAQGLVAAFNGFQESISSLQPLFVALAGTSFVDQFSQALSELAATTVVADSSSLSNLATIGIQLQPATAGSGTLLIDQSALIPAVTANPAGARVLLEQAAQSLLEQATGFEAQVAGAANALTNLTQPIATAVPPIDLDTGLGLNSNLLAQVTNAGSELAQDLTDTAALNDIQLANLALFGLNAEPSATNSSENNALQSALIAADLLASTTTAIPLVANPALPAASLTLTTSNGTPAPANVAAPAATAAPLDSPATTVLPPVTTAAVPTASPATTTNGVAADAIAADRDRSAATLALQNLFNDPGLRAVNNLSDPLYSALIAATHLSDFILPGQLGNPNEFLPDIPEPISPAARISAIGYYNEAASGESRQGLQRIS